MNVTVSLNLPTVVSSTNCMWVVYWMIFLLGRPFKTEILTLENVTCKLMLLKSSIISERGMVEAGFNDVDVIWKNSTTWIKLDT